MLSVGSTVWVFDENHRVYRRNEKGRSEGGPIYREHFVECKITGETSRSWIIGRYRMKVNKKTLDGMYISQEQIDLKCWANDHKYGVVRMIEYSTDGAMIKAVADLIGYKDAPRGAGGA